MEFLFKRTDELSDKEVRELCGLFSSIFAPDRSPEGFRSQFLKTPLNYSYHGLMRDDGRIVGAYSSVPYRYIFDGRELLFALSVDTMVAEEHRGSLWNLVRMANLVYEAARKDGVAFAFCFPNESIHLVRKKVLKWRDIGMLSYYALPLSTAVACRALRFADPLLKLGAAGLTRLAAAEPGAATGAQGRFLVEKKTDQAFIDYRYSFYHRYSEQSGGYVKIDTRRGHFVYRRETIEGLETAFIIDVYPLTRRHLDYAARRVFEAEKSRVGAILYLGHLPFRPSSLLRVPRRLEPKPLYMMGRELIEGVVDERIYDIGNWCVNLSNYEAV